MDLLWPGFLYLLVLIPLLIGIYAWVLRRRRRFTLRYSSLALIRDAQPRRTGLRRHLPFALFLLALASLIAALSRPAAVLSLPTNEATIIFAIDVSGSMRSRDIPPNRLEAAENAALTFIQHQKATTQIGLVAFSTFAEVVQTPTPDQGTLQSAIESLTLGRRTAIGSGILKSLDAIAQVDPTVAPSYNEGDPGPAPTPVPKGDYAPDIIVLLTDGVSNYGPLPLDAARQAADRGVRVYTIGFGTPNGSIPFDNGGAGGGFGFNPGPQGGFGQGFGGFGGFGGFRAGIDVTTLKQIASMTGGQYYAASSASELENVFQSLPTYLITKHEILELSVAFAAFGAALVLAAILLSLRWNPLP